MTKQRRHLPDTRTALTHKFTVGGHDGYLTVGLYEDGQPGEIFLQIAKEGSTISGFLDAFAITFSLALQYGVPLEHLVKKLSHMRFEPAGFTGNKDLGYANSIVDYVVRWLEAKFLTPKVEAFDAPEFEWKEPEGTVIPVLDSVYDHDKTFVNSIDAPACIQCGAITVRSGSCYLCRQCGSTSGCS